MPRTYQLILRTVEAFQVVNDMAEIDRGAQWCGGVPAIEIDPETKQPYPSINVPTLSGVQRASWSHSGGDYIVRNPIAGTFEVIKRERFENDYELVS